MSRLDPMCDPMRSSLVALILALSLSFSPAALAKSSRSKKTRMK